MNKMEERGRRDLGKDAEREEERGREEIEK
jgi:hypothetical protein